MRRRKKRTEGMLIMIFFRKFDESMVRSVARGLAKVVTAQPA